MKKLPVVREPSGPTWTKLPLRFSSDDKYELILAACARCLSSKVVKMLDGARLRGSGITGLGGVVAAVVTGAGVVDAVGRAAFGVATSPPSRAFGAGRGSGIACAIAEG